MMDAFFVQLSMAVLGLATIGLHVTRKNRNEALLYGAQSTAIVVLLVLSFVHEHSWTLLLIAVLTLLVKVVLAPSFFIRLIKRHELKFGASTHANAPEIFAAIAGILILSASGIFAPLTNIVPGNHSYLVLSLAAMLTSILLMVNRRGVLSQAVGILSLENSIVAFALFAGLEQSPVLQLGVVFDVCVWAVIASVFVAMVHKHFGSLDVTTMKKLKG